MARTATLLELKTQARQRADQVNSTFVSDAELTSYINESATELYDLLVTSYETYYLTSQNVTVVSGTDTYALPTTFYKLKGIDFNPINPPVGQSAITLMPYNFNERNRFVYTPAFNIVGLNSFKYSVQGSNIKFIPVPSQGGTIVIWFIPYLGKMVLDTDTLDGINGWEEYVVVDAAIKMMQKEESDPQALMIQKEALKKRIEQSAPSRDAGFPKRMSDVRRANPFGIPGYGQWR